LLFLNWMESEDPRLEDIFYEAECVRVFIKREVHTREKLDKGRYRLIQCMPVLPRILHLVLTCTQEIELYSNPPKGFKAYENNLTLSSILGFHAEFDDCDTYVTDMSAHDYTVPLSVHAAVLIHRAETCYAPFEKHLKRLDSFRYNHETRGPGSRLFVFSDGSTQRCQTHSVVTGHNDTLSNNTLMILAFARSFAKRCWVAGDDSCCLLPRRRLSARLLNLVSD